MSNYAESKKKLDAIRSKYGCKGEIIFRTAIQMLVDAGKCTILDSNWYQTTMDDIDTKYDKAEAEGKFLFMTRDFEKAIYECSKELCDVDTYDILMYIQKEIWLGGDEISYQRAIELLKCALQYHDDFEADSIDEAYDTFQCIGLNDKEIEELGFGYLLDVEEEEE